MLPNPEYSVTSIAKLLGVSPGTLYNHIPDLKELRAQRALGTGPSGAEPVSLP
jgi:transposase-like protein